MKVTRDGNPITIVRHDAPHETGEGGWHGAFVLPESGAPAPVAAQFGQQAMQPSPHVDGWLGQVVSVEFTAAPSSVRGGQVMTASDDSPSVPIRVSAARIVALSGNRAEWEGAEDVADV